MKEYDISIVETLEKTVTVKADSKEAAEEMVREQYYNSEHILDADNFKEVDFKLHLREKHFWKQIRKISPSHPSINSKNLEHFEHLQK